MKEAEGTKERQEAQENRRDAKKAKTLKEYDVLFPGLEVLVLSV